MDQIQHELQKMREVYGEHSLASDLKFKITSGTAHYNPKTKTVFISLETLNRIHVGVLWHECGHAIAHMGGFLGKGEYTWEAGYDELIADTVSLLRFDTVEEMKAKGGAFAQNVSAKAWKDHEEHQLLVPARSFIGQKIMNLKVTKFTPDLKASIAKRIFASAIRQSQATAVLAQADPLGYRGFKETPETLNDKMIQDLEVSFR